MREGQKPREGQQPAPSPPSHGSDATAQRSTISLTASCPLRPRHGAWSAQGYTGGNDGAWVCPAVPGPQEAPKCILPTVSSVIPTGWEGGCGWQVSIPGKLASVGPAPCPPPQGNWPPHSTPLTHLLSPKGRCSPLSRPHHPLQPLRGLQETRVATREESGVLGFPSRRGLTPRGNPLQYSCLKNPHAPRSLAGFSP